MTKARRTRLIIALCVLCGAAATAGLIAAAFQRNLMYFFTPSQLEERPGGMPSGELFRLGGLVGAIERREGDLEIVFEVTDTRRTVPVSYSGVLPDLFREGQGVVVRGRLREGVMVAEEVLAKHDENYMPPEVAEGLEEVGIRWPEAK